MAPPSTPGRSRSVHIHKDDNSDYFLGIYWSFRRRSCPPIAVVLALGFAFIGISSNIYGQLSHPSGGLDAGPASASACTGSSPVSGNSRVSPRSFLEVWRGGGGANRPSNGWHGKGLSVTIFCAPKPYDGPEGATQRQALLSWLRLDPPAKIVLMGSDPSFRAVAREFGRGRISVEPELDANFLGLPLFHSMVARARAADSAVSLLLNADIVLLAGLYPALATVAAAFPNWVLTGMRWDLEAFPFSFNAAPPHAIAGALGSDEAAASADEFVQSNGVLHTYGGVDFWAWNNAPGVALHLVPMPPFANGRGRFDNWLTHEMVQSGLRTVVDGSDAVTTVHVKHSYRFVTDGKDSVAAEEKGRNFWTQNKGKAWEAYLNVHLSQQFGTNFTNQLGTANHIPWKLARCLVPGGGDLCLLRRRRPGVCQCEHSPFVEHAQTDPHLQGDGRTWQCGMRSVDKEYHIDPLPSNASVPGLPHVREDLLAQVADADKVVVLVAANFGYSEVLMNFACQLRSLGLTNLLVAALDADLYRFAFEQGLPVYYEAAGAALLANVSAANCTFGSVCFRKYTKLKSRAVLDVLRAGYHVLWSDIDVVWFSNPLPTLLAFGPGVLPIQSNEPNASLPANGHRRINSGFYFARSEKVTIDAFADVVQHASTTSLSEQPSFFDVLCGVQGENRRGDDGCAYRGLTVRLLDRRAFPNGAVHGLWNASDVAGACAASGALILHNNWISGVAAKKERLLANGMWRYDEKGRMCIHSWHPSAHSVRLPFSRVP